MFGAIVKAVTGGGGGGRSGGLRTVKNQGAAIARQQILDYTGADYLGAAASMALTVDSVAQLEDINRYIAEQKELLAYAAKKIQAITENVAEIEQMISEIIAQQLKTRAQVDKYISNAHLAGDKYSADSAKLNQHHSNQQKIIAGQTAGEMALDNVQTKMALLNQKALFDQKRKNMEVMARTQKQNQATALQQRLKASQEASARRQRITKGDGNKPSGVNFTRFRSQI